ncbi:ParA family protein, partial [Mesomycoplasma ovipneumoniae]|uniref:ParA family protein n=1 Tax=Mesomycoplasma ovipneumoniae TaxID=29562 RepID=UPI003CC980E1
MNNKGTMRTIAHMDYVFCPITADRVVMQSSLTFAKVINDKLVTTGTTNIKGLYFVWNMVDAREKTRLYEVYERIIGELGLSALNTEIPDSKRFRREGDTEDKRPLFRPTMFPPDKALIKGSCIKELTDEIMEIVKPWADGEEHEHWPGHGRPHRERPSWDGHPSCKERARAGRSPASN